jgi:hypothetical protein
MKQQKPKQKQRPAHQVVRSFGGSLLRAAIWRHSDDQKGTRYSVSFSKVYRSKASGKWESASGSYFNRDDCVGLVGVAESAYAWCIADGKKGEKPNE